MFGAVHHHQIGVPAFTHAQPIGCFRIGSASFAVTAPVAGTYTIVLDPYNDYTGSATVSLS
jgi:hypothetical protein